jgi:hypothetical protein
MLNVDVTEPGLDRSDVAARVRQMKPTTVSEHVRVNREGDASFDASSSDDLAESRRRQAAASLVLEDMISTGPILHQRAERGEL